MADKAYLRYVNKQNAGVIASLDCVTMICTELPHATGTVAVANSNAGTSKNSKKTAATVFSPSLSSIGVWNLRTGRLEDEIVSESAHKTEVTSMLLNAPRDTIIAGYSNGYVSVYSRNVAEDYWEEVFHALGHKPDTKVFALAFHPTEPLAFSGGQDTDVTVWDITAQEALVRFHGHRGTVVGLHVLPNGQVLSAGADGVLKLWETELRASVQTVVVTDASLTAMIVDPAGLRAIVGSVEDSLRVYDLSPLAEGGEIVPYGTLPRRSRRPVLSLQFSHHHRFLGVLASDRSLELFNVLSAADIKKKVSRKKKRRKEKLEKAGVAVDGEEADDGAAEQFLKSAAEEITPARIYRHATKLKAFAFLPSGPEASVVACTAVNSIAVVQWPKGEDLTVEDPDDDNTKSLSAATVTKTIELPGHRASIRGLTLLPDYTGLASLATDGLRLWAPQTSSLVCTNYIAVDEATAFCVLPGGQYFAVATEDGSLIAASVPKAAVVSRQAAHSASIMSLASAADASCITTVGRDNRVVQWTLGVGEDADGEQTVTFTVLREMILNDSPVAVQHSPDNKFVAVGLQDSTVKLFFQDSLKLFLSLYGHKLPTTSLAFPTDSSVIVTGSMDKNIRIWGTDYGDCHRAIHAHDDYVTAVQFVPDTHIFFSASKDGTVKEWDADTWQLIQVFKYHLKSVWCVAINADGTFFASAGEDKCIQTFERTEEPLYPEEEMERMAQEMQDAAAAKKSAQQLQQDSLLEAGLGGHRSIKSIDAGETIMDTLDMIDVELQRRKNKETRDTTAPHPAFSKKGVYQYLWEVLAAIKPSEIRHATSLLTSVHCNALMYHIAESLKDQAASAAGENSSDVAPGDINYDLAARITLAVMRPATASGTRVGLWAPEGSASGRQLLVDLHRGLHGGLQHHRSRFGENMAAMRMVQARMERRGVKQFFDVSKAQGAKRQYTLTMKRDRKD